MSDNGKTKINQVLESYLSGSNLSAEDAAGQLVELASASEDSNAAVFDEILTRIRSASHDSPIQDKLVQLLGAKSTWTPLDALGISIRDLWNGTVEQHGVVGWASLNAFVARLAQAEVSDFDDYGIWSIRSALEDFTFEDPAAVTGKVKEGELNPDVLDKFIPAAAVWPIYAGRRLLALSKEAKEGSRSTRGGPSWTGKPGYNLERWNFWKERLEGFSGRNDLAEETRNISRVAYEAMKE